MEGACGKIVLTDNPQVVIKKVHRRNRPHQRTCSLRAREQALMQEWARSVCDSLGCKILYVPRAWDATQYSYKMDKIRTDKPLLDADIKSHAVLPEMKSLYVKAKEEGIFPIDYELYIQDDGRVAMVDFDKFGSWLGDGSMMFPWGLVLTVTQVEDILKTILG